MTAFESRFYENRYQFKLEPLSSESCCLKVTYSPQLIGNVGVTDFSAIAYNREIDPNNPYIISCYSRPEQALSHAKGWADCWEHFYLSKHTPDYYEDDEKDSYKNKYEEKLNWHKNNIDEQDKGLLFCESAYKEGWDKKIWEFKNR